MAQVAAEPQNSRKAEAEMVAPARERGSVASAARKMMEKMVPRVPPHVFWGLVMHTNQRLVLQGYEEPR
jgi:hypothetical protein